MEKCEYCKKSSPILQCCPHCERVWYCSESHMLHDQPVHQRECFPAIVHTDEDCGRYWIASRDISKGELIFTEVALAIGPGPGPSSASPLYPTCLGCCRTTNTSYYCSKCRWHMCSRTCEKLPQHANFECKVFRKNKIHSSTRPEYYLFIHFLRGILLKTNNPSAFKQLMDLEPHVEGRRGHKEESELTNSFFKFLSEDCNLHYDFDFIDKIVGAIRINSYSADILSNTNAKKRTCTALFSQTSLLNHDCLPNTRTVIYENEDLSIKIGLFAAIDIWKGQCITQQYFPIVQGTMNRRKALREWFFDCSCKRCSDPTEFGTYFSCLPCSDCQVGYICPLDSLDDLTEWVCNKCGLKHSSEEIQKTLNDIEKVIEANNATADSLERVLNDFLVSKRLLHEGHFLAINAKYYYVHKVVNALNNEREVNELRNGQKYCKHILKVVDVLCPGLSYFRGVILYFLANCVFALYEMESLSCDDCDISELKEIIAEGIEIMEVEARQTIYSDMVDELETFQRSLRKVQK